MSLALNGICRPPPMSYSHPHLGVGAGSKCPHPHDIPPSWVSDRRSWNSLRREFLTGKCRATSGSPSDWVDRGQLAQSATPWRETLFRSSFPVMASLRRMVAWVGYSFGLLRRKALLNLERGVSPYVGCASTRILCRRGCAHERRIRAGGRIHFFSGADAQRSGYRPCTVCQPT